MERAFGDIHDKCPRNHKRERLHDRVKDVEQPVQNDGPWQYTLSHLYEAPEIPAAVKRIAAEKPSKIAA